MSNGVPLLEVSRLRTYFHRPDRTIRAVDDVSFALQAGETLGIVGESGCGKTLTCLSILGLVDEPGRIEPGSSIRLRGRELTTLPEVELRRIRGDEIAMVFQEPSTSLNPVWTVGEQIAETVRLHRGGSAHAARERALEMLRLVGIPDPDRRLDEYPHQLSGGMRQRVMIGVALACDPALVIADEPTTALDVTVQAEILELLRTLQARLGMAMILVTHDLGVVAQVADRVLVMYAGQAVESGRVEEIFRAPRHPYTEGLLRSIPRLDDPADRLVPIPGTVPDPARWPSGCRFHPRCPYAWDRCREEHPPLLGDVRPNRCWLEEEPERREHRAGAGR